MSKNTAPSFFISIPHSGENFPDNVKWLKGLPEPTLMRDVDRYVDELYLPVIDRLQIPSIVTQWHRYVVDLNRTTDEIDQQSVKGASEPVGKHPKGLHWSVTTIGETLIPSPMNAELHSELVEKYYQPFHDQVGKMRAQLKRENGVVYHIDAHSMPSQGTQLHRDPGELRAEVVVSDFEGKSCSPQFKDLVMAALQKVGLQVAYNWPYVGGGITQMYGRPEEGYHTLQIELNRQLYMDEATKQKKPTHFIQLQKQISEAIELIYNDLLAL